MPSRLAPLAFTALSSLTARDGFGFHPELWMPGVAPQLRDALQRNHFVAAVLAAGRPHALCDIVAYAVAANRLDGSDGSLLAGLLPAWPQALQCALAPTPFGQRCPLLGTDNQDRFETLPCGRLAGAMHDMTQKPALSAALPTPGSNAAKQLLQAALSLASRLSDSLFAYQEDGQPPAHRRGLSGIR